MNSLDKESLKRVLIKAQQLVKDEKLDKEEALDEAYRRTAGGKTS